MRGDRAGIRARYRGLGGGPLAAACLLVLGPLGAPSGGADVTFTPGISVTGEYNDNINFSRTDARSDALATVSPSLGWAAATERTEVRGSIAADVLRYAREHDLDEERQAYDLHLAQRPSPRLQWSAGARYRKDSTLESELEETGIVTTRSDRYRFGPEAGVSLDLGERSAAGLRYSFRRTLYDSPSLVDYDYHEASATLERKLDDRLSTVTVRPELGRFLSDANDVTTYGVSVGWAPRLSETLSASALVGGRYTVVDYPASPARPGGERERNRGLLAQLSVQRSWETAEASLGYARSLTYSSEGEPVELDAVSLGFRRRFSVRWAAGFSGSYRRTRSTADSSPEATTYFDLTPSLSYRLTEHHTVRAAYSYANSFDRELSSDRLAERHRVWVTAAFNFPRKW